MPYSRLEDLLATSTPAIGQQITTKPDGVPDDLLKILTVRNGFYAFESALHLYPVGPSLEVSVMEWNSPVLWVGEYADMSAGLWFFAEDAFGNQFALADSSVVLFDPETGQTSPVASALSDWPDAVLSDYEYLTGWPIAHEWQIANGPLPTGMRLVPKMPFVAGGAYTADNLYAMNAVEAMRLRANLARQIRDLPDGAQFKFEITD